MIFLLSWLLLLRTSLAADCYFRDGSLTLNDDGTSSYVQCPGVDWCCKPTDTCTTNGLCRDINNHQDGSNVTLSDGTANMTGLYQTPACINSDFEGCVKQCTSTQNYALYLWACDDALTEYCCSGGYSLYDQKACCADNANFELGAASTTSSVTSTTTASSSQISSSTTSTTTSSSVSVTAAAASGSGTAPPAPTEEAGKSSSGSLSQGAKIGVGVGTAVGVLVLGALIALLWRLYKIQKRLERTKGQATDYTDVEPVAVTRGQGPNDYMKVSYGIAEMEQPLAEADGTEQPAELEGDRRDKGLPLYR